MALALMALRSVIVLESHFLALFVVNQPDTVAHSSAKSLSIAAAVAMGQFACQSVRLVQLMGIRGYASQLKAKKRVLHVLLLPLTNQMKLPPKCVL